MQSIELIHELSHEKPTEIKEAGLELPTVVLSKSLKIIRLRILEN